MTEEEKAIKWIASVSHNIALKSEELHYAKILYNLVINLQVENERLKSRLNKKPSILTFDYTSDVYDDFDKYRHDWDTLKKFIQKEIDMNLDGINRFSGYQCNIILDEMKRLEGEDKNVK